MRPLLEHIEAGRLDPPTFVITHRLRLDDYETFKHKEDDFVTVVLASSR